MVKAKKNNPKIGIPQCAAQMLGARLCNEAYDNQLDRVYGCVTTADDWIFLKLEGETIYVDNSKNYSTFFSR